MNSQQREIVNSDTTSNEPISVDDLYEKITWTKNRSNGDVAMHRGFRCVVLYLYLAKYFNLHF